MKPYVPIYKRPPNKFIRFEERKFHGGMLTIAVFQNKKGKEQELVILVKWRNNERDSLL